MAGNKTEINKSNNTSSLQSNLWLRRLWAALPVTTLILLLGIIFVMQSWINSEGKIIKERKAKELSGEKAPVNVVALELHPRRIREQLNLPGVIRPWIELTVVAEVRGKILSKKAFEGQKVKIGDILAVIDQRSYQNTYNSAKAAFMAAKAEHERILVLYQDHLVTQSQLDDARASLESAKANMDTAALNLERCTITSPMDGIINKVYIENGRFMNDAEPVADILQLDRVKVQVSIPESDVDAVRRVENFTISIDALNGKTFSGRQRYLAKAAQSLARSYLLEIAIDNPKGEILPDMFARVTIVKRQVEAGLAVPLFSLANGKNGKAVFLVENGVARLTPIKTGIQQGWQIQAKEGLAPGAKVVVVGQKDIKNGSKIHVLRTVSDPEELSK